MGRITLNQDYYDAIVAAFRVDPENYSAAAKRAGISRNTAKLAWSRGWPDAGFAPVEKTLELEQLEARKLRCETDDRITELRNDEAANDAAMRAKARRDAIRARGEEGRMVAAARASAINLLESTKTLTSGVVDLAPKIRAALARIDLDKATLKDIDAVGRILWRLSISTRAGAATAWTILQSERLLLGQPTDIIGITDLDNMDESDAMRELEAAAATLERMKARKAKGGLLVIDGGADPDDSDVQKITQIAE